MGFGVFFLVPWEKKKGKKKKEEEKALLPGDGSLAHHLQTGSPSPASVAEQVFHESLFPRETQICLQNIPAK